MQCLLAVSRNSAQMQSAVSSVLLQPAISTSKFSYVHKKLGGKAVWLALLIVLSSLLTYSPNAKGDECGPATTSDCGTWSAWTEVPVSAAICTTVYIPINGTSVGCQACFGYRYRTCGTVYQIEVNKFRIENPCYDYMRNLALYGSPADKETWSNIVESMWQYGELPCAKDFFKTFRNGNTNYDCLGPTGCSSAIGLSTVQAYSAKCYEYIDTEAVTGGSCIATTWRVGCVSENCCIKTWQMCYDATTGQVRTCSPTTTSYGIAPTCSGFSSFTAPSGCTITHRSGCKSVTCPQ